MANKYTAMLIPRKHELEFLYFDHEMSQVEIGQIYETTQKVVWRWFRKLGIKSRIAAKRDQNGPRNHQWKGDACGYAALHLRVERLKGKPMRCDECGTVDLSKSYDWANISGEYLGVNDFKKLCRSCHAKLDNKIRNLQ